MSDVSLSDMIEVEGYMLLAYILARPNELKYQINNITKSVLRFDEIEKSLEIVNVRDENNRITNKIIDARSLGVLNLMPRCFLALTLMIMF